MRQGGTDDVANQARTSPRPAPRDVDQTAGLFEPGPPWTFMRVSRRFAGLVLGFALVPWLAVEFGCALELPGSLAVFAAWMAVALGIAVTVDLATGLGDRRVPERQQWRFVAAITALSAGEWVVAVVVLVRGVSTTTAPWLYCGFALALLGCCLASRSLLGPRPRLLVVAARHRRKTIDAAARATGRSVVRWIDPCFEALGLTLDEGDDEHDYDELALEDGCFVRLRDIPHALRHRAMYIFMIDPHQAARPVPRHLLGSSPGLVSRAFRRAFDIGVATAAIVVTAPLLVVSALALRKDCGGGVVLRQTRIGRNGRRFIMYRLRTDPTHADDHHRDVATLRVGRDGRGAGLVAPTPEVRARTLGAWVHRCGIDRLPTLWNVLNGTMSIVGPRPPLPSEIELYTCAEIRRMRIKPGMVVLSRAVDRAETSIDGATALESLRRSHGSL